MTGKILYKSDELIVVQKPPICRTIYIIARQRGAEHIWQPYFLSFPWTIFVVSTQSFGPEYVPNVLLGCSCEPLETLQSNVCGLPLPNIGKNLTVCLGRWGGRLGTGIESVAETAIDKFWKAGFSSDNSYYWRHIYGNKLYGNKHWTRWDEWAKLTKENPKFILEPELYLQSFALQELIANIGNGDTWAF